MINRTPTFSFQGDKLRAKKWSGWAMVQLERIKLFSINGIVNKVLRPVQGVAVHIRSVNDMDYIRIAVAGGGCRNDFDNVPAEPYPSPFETRFIAQHWVNNKKLKLDSRIWGEYNYGDGTSQFIGSVGSWRDHIYPNSGDYDVILYSFVRGGVDDVINMTSFNITPYEAVFTVDTTGTIKALGFLVFLLSFSRTVSDITVSIDGKPVEVTTHPSTPNRSVRIILPKATGKIMTAVVTLLNPTPPLTGWLVLENFAFIKYKCLGTTKKTITVT